MTVATTLVANTPPTATLVSDERRPAFLPRLFGLRHLLVAETTVYNIMDQLSPDYGGGFWDFLELSGEPLYLRPASDLRFRIASPNGYEGDLSADAAGIVATLFTLSHLSLSNSSERLADGYQHLYAYAADHPEAQDIFRAID